MERTDNTGWIVSGVLAVVIVILLAMMWQQWDKQQKDLGMVLQNGKESIAQARDEINKECNGPQGTDDPDCQDALTQMSNVLKQFSKNINTATSSGDMMGQTANP